MNIQLPDLPLLRRETLERYLPVVLAVAIAWLLARGLNKALWSAFALYWAFRASGFWS